jgi:hypothetical protein
VAKRSRQASEKKSVEIVAKSRQAHNLCKFVSSVATQAEGLKNSVEFRAICGK